MAATTSFDPTAAARELRAVTGRTPTAPALSAAVTALSFTASAPSFTASAPSAAATGS
jgi:hypothetical protein